MRVAELVDSLRVLTRTTRCNRSRRAGTGATVAWVRSGAHGRSAAGTAASSQGLRLRGIVAVEVPVDEFCWGHSIHLRDPIVSPERPGTLPDNRGTATQQLEMPVASPT